MQYKLGTIQDLGYESIRLDTTACAIKAKLRGESPYDTGHLSEQIA